MTKKSIVIMCLVLLLVSTFAVADRDTPYLAYSFDNATISASNVLDQGSLKNNGTITGATSGVVGRFADAISFDGTNDQVITTLNINITGSQDRTITFFFKMNAWVSLGSFFGWGQASADATYQASLGSSVGSPGILRIETNGGDLTTVNTTIW